MAIPRALQAFVEGAPCAVLTRLSPNEWLTTMCPYPVPRSAVTQYDRDITITHLVEVMLDIACGWRHRCGQGFCGGRRKWLRRSRRFTASSIEPTRSWVWPSWPSSPASCRPWASS